MTDLPGFETVDATELDYTDPADLVDLGLLRASELVPGWVPREGNVEVVLLEQFAVLMAALVERVEAVVPQVTMQILEMSGLTRFAGEAAELTVTVSVSDTFGHVVPAGTQVVVGDPDADEPLTGTLAEAVTVNEGDYSATGTVVLDEPGVVTDLSVATEVLLIDAVVYVEAITVDAVVSSGLDAETDAEFLARGSAWLQAMTQVLGRPDQFSARALTDVRVGRALAVNRWDGAGTPGEVAGAVTVLVLDTAGAALDGAVLTEIQEALQAVAVTELTVTVDTPTVTPVDVEVTVTLLPGYVAESVIAAVEASIAAYLSALVWEWGGALRLSRLLQVIETTAGVDSAVIAAPEVDVEPTAYELLEAGTVTVAV